MAKRRLLDSTSQANHPPFRAHVLLGFLFLLISLISINCASFRQQQQHRYRNDDNLDSLVGQWAPSPISRLGLRALPSPEPALSVYEQSPSLAEDRQRFYSLLQLLANTNNNYYDDNQYRDDSLLATPSLVFSESRNGVAANQYQLEGANKDHQYSPLPATSGDDIDNRRLLDLLSLSQSLNERQAASSYNDDSGGTQFVELNPKQQHISPYQILDADPEVDSSSPTKQEDSDKNFAYQVEEQQSGDGQTEKRSGSQQEEKPASNTNTTVTTLIDEDEELGAKVDSSSSGKDDKKANASTVADQVSHGKVVVTKEDNQQLGGDKSSPATGSLSKVGSMLTGLYKFLANHWPDALKTNKEPGDLSGTQKVTVIPLDDTEQQTKTTPTNTSVSELAATAATATNNDKLDLAKSGSNEIGSSNINNNSNNIVKETLKSEERDNRWSTVRDNQEENYDKPTNEDGSSSPSSKQTIRIKPKKDDRQEQARKISLLRQSTNLVMPLKSSDELVVESSGADDQTGGSLPRRYVYAPRHHYHLSTASSFADTKRLVATATASAGADIAGDDEDAAEADGQMFAKMSQQYRPRNIHAGDDVYAASAFSSLRPAAAFYGSHGLTSAEDRNDRLAFAPSKSNDIYFLVMVAAFCSMAMAVVLAAGLFAYRVQQNRKSHSEADYPTYGVVGPNNMSTIGANGNGKCGAASFVGGYFTGMGGPGSSSSGSKSGSVKQLADMYSIGADSGISAGAKSVAGGKRVILANDQTAQLAANGAATANNNHAHGNGQNRFANQNAARMFHYQHQKQQMINSDRASNGRQTSASDLDSEEENDENSYTVYECPGLASAHEMEIKNPLFNDDQTP